MSYVKRLFTSLLPEKNSVKELLLATARETIETEINSISQLTDRLDAGFLTACDLLIKCRGKTIISGIGKSGHIGRKIAATLASTGTSAFYVHPAEALHGDLGMIAPGDMVILISYSGFAAEFTQMIPLLRAISVGIIAFTGNANSPLGLSADCIINIQTNREACPLGLAPTSSAVNTLVMGDALAIALMRARNFSESDYARTHPAGALGTRLLCKVGDIMRKGEKLPCVDSNVTVSDALFELTRTGLGLVVITDQKGRLQGVFTDGDLRRWLLKGGDIQTKIAGALTPKPHTLVCSQLATDALNLFHERKITAAPVLDPEGNVTGAISLHDIHDNGIF